MSLKRMSMASDDEPVGDGSAWLFDDDGLVEMLRVRVPSNLIAGDRRIKALIVKALARAADMGCGGEPPPDAILGSALRDVEELASRFAPCAVEGCLGQANEFWVTDLIGVGGAGVVFSARDPCENRDVAIKFLRPSFSQANETESRFVSAAEAAAAINHENVIVIHKVERLEQIPFFVMPLLKGVTLRQRLIHEPLDPKQALAIARQLAAGLDAGHRAGLLHLAVKPENIWLEAESDQVKLLDFGIAHSVGLNGFASEEVWNGGAVDYASPEVVRGEVADARSDLYSLGVVIHEMISGTRPFRRHGIALTRDAILHDPPPPIGPGKDRLQGELNAIATNLMAKSPAMRPSNALDCTRKLGQLEPLVDSAEVPGRRPPRLWFWGKRP